MVRRIASWAVFSVQMSFERFRTGQVDLLFFNIVLSLVSKHESEERNSRSRLEVEDLKEEILNLVVLGCSQISLSDTFQKGSVRVKKTKKN